MQVAVAVAYFAAGMVLWIGGTLAWQFWQAPSAAIPPARPTPAPAVTENLSQSYLAAAERTLEAYRTSADPWLYDFDWQKAEICLERAVNWGAGMTARSASSRSPAATRRSNASMAGNTLSRPPRSYG